MLNWTEEELRQMREFDAEVDRNLALSVMDMHLSQELDRQAADDRRDNRSLKHIRRDRAHYTAVKDRKNTRRRERRATDPVYRERMNAQKRLAYAKAAEDPAYRETINARRNAQHAQRMKDPTYRKAYREKMKPVWDAQNADRKTRMERDPEYREKMHADARARYHKKKNERKGDAEHG